MPLCLRALALLLTVVLPAAHAQQDTSRVALARTPHFTPAAALDGYAGVFAYRFGAPGWPDALSIDGLPPHYTRLRLDAIPYDDLVTGAPRSDLLPVAWLDTLTRGTPGAVASIEAALRHFDAPRPRTELRYLSGPDGFQSIEAVHAQSRRRRVLGRSGQLDALFGYAGRAADNEYPNSRLKRGRTTLARVGFSTGALSVRLSNLHARGTVGAPGGVLPPDPADPGSIYDRFNATVRNLRARRQTIYNTTDIAVRRGPGRLTLYRTAERLRYADDSVVVSRMARYGFASSLGAGGRAFEAEGWWQHAGDASATQGRTGWLYAGLRDTLGGVAVRAGASYGGTLRPALHVATGPAWARFAAEAAAAPRPAVAFTGFGSYARGRDLPDPYAATAHATFRAGLGRYRLWVRPFASATFQGWDAWEEARDSLTIIARDVRRAGATVGVEAGTAALRGLYASAQSTVARCLDSDRRSDDLPLLTGAARLGLRATLFQGDLRADLYAHLQGWTAFRGRVLHDPTGLLALTPENPRVPASATLDLNALLHVRSATLFLAWENVLSGTALLRGNLLVPEYPLPERRLRFGVFWPITD